MNKKPVNLAEIIILVVRRGCRARHGEQEIPGMCCNFAGAVG